ncbi:MAG: glycosyltransferase family 2 protein [Rikenellaceae bacterium]
MILKPKVTIITVVWNAKDALKRTIETIKQLKYDNLEYIVVDGDSTDGTKEVIEQNSINITSWISEKDNGIYDAMNKALRMATGDYVWFMNAGDTIYSSDILSDIFSGCETYADIYYGDTVILSEDFKVKGLRGKRPPRRLSVSSFKYGMSVCHQSVIVKRTIAPLYDLNYRYCADIDWLLQCIKSAKTKVNCNMIFTNFVEGGVSMQHKKESLMERYEIMVKYYGRVATLFNHIIITFKKINSPYRKLK